jgi:Sulfotransferase family
MLLTSALQNQPSSAGVDAENGRMVVILGVPRSGTSWLGKIFDSHPFVVYRHEPDSVIEPEEFPVLCPIEEIPLHVAAVRRYFKRLIRVRQIKSSGTWPIFSKPYQPFGAPLLRRALAFGLRSSEGIAPRARWPKRIPIPDFIHSPDAGLTYVIKSISLLGSALLVARALPEARIIAVFRHPCGQIASVKREPSSPLLGGSGLASPLDGRRARELGMTLERFNRMPEFDQHVWSWALLHDKLFREAADIPNVHLLRYEDLCREPIQQAHALMKFAQLAWTDETSRFVERSTRGGGRESYFSVFRDPMESATKWKKQLEPIEIKRCMEIVEMVLPGRFSMD